MNTISLSRITLSAYLVLIHLSCFTAAPQQHSPFADHNRQLIAVVRSCLGPEIDQPEQTEEVQQLIDLKANINFCDKKSGKTSLAYAIRPQWVTQKDGTLMPLCCRRTIELLMAAGADPSISDNNGHTPLSFIESRLSKLDNIKNHDNDQVRLRNHYGMAYLALKAVIPHSHIPLRVLKSTCLEMQLIETIKAYITRTITKIDANHQVQKLLRRGADATAQDQEGNTALHWAVHPRPPHNYFSTEIITTLIIAGAPINQENDEGLTPLELIQAGKCNTPFPDNYLEGVLNVFIKAVPLQQ